MDATDLVGVVGGDSGVCDGRVRVPHHALVSTVAVVRPVVAGQPFQPDARLKPLVIEAADVAWAMNQAVSMAPRFKDVAYYPGAHGESVMTLDPARRAEYWRDLDARINCYFQGTMVSPAMEDKRIGQGSQYLRSARDSQGDWLDGSKPYRLHVTAHMPVKEFWSVSVYDYEPL
jgi:hypothetical protein